MYVRSNGNGRERVRVPENYSGHAFRDQNPYGDMPPPTRIPPSPPQTQKDKSERAREDETHFSPIYPTEREEDFIPDMKGDDDVIRNDERAPVSSQHEDKNNSEKANSIFSSLIPTVSSSKRFPFGHGIGGEELLLLALMLIIYLSDEADEELLILLGFLLFSG